MWGLLRKTFHQVYQHTDRILIAEFSGNLVTTVIVVNSPTNVDTSEEEEKFFEKTPAHNLLSILEDFNARFRSEEAPCPYHETTNSISAYLSTFLMEHKLLAAKTLFLKRASKRWTF